MREGSLWQGTVSRGNKPDSEQIQIHVMRRSRSRVARRAGERLFVSDHHEDPLFVGNAALVCSDSTRGDIRRFTCEDTSWRCVRRSYSLRVADLVPKLCQSL